MSEERVDVERGESRSERIAIYRTADAERILGERTARLAEEAMFGVEGAIESAEKAVSAGELSESALAELRDIHRRIRQRAMSTSPQGRLI